MLVSYIPILLASVCVCVILCVCVCVCVYPRTPPRRFKGSVSYLKDIQPVCRWVSLSIYHDLKSKFKVLGGVKVTPQKFKLIRSGRAIAHFVAFENSLTSSTFFLSYVKGQGHHIGQSIINRIDYFYRFKSHMSSL